MCEACVLECVLNKNIYFTGIMQVCVFVSEDQSVCVCLCVHVQAVGDLAHFNLWQREDVVKTIITVSLSLITAR